VIYRREMLHDVGAQHVSIASGEGLQPIDGPMRPPADTISVAVGNEQTLEPGLDDVA
jgi:hypothetical protein